LRIAQLRIASILSGGRFPNRFRTLRIAIRYADHRPETSSDAGMHIDNN
jgi:hypothetical protein